MTTASTNSTSTIASGMEPILRLSRDIKAAAKTLTAGEARYLVDKYYQMQDDRIRANNQVRASTDSGEPNQLVVWLADNNGVLERNIKSALEAYAKNDPLSQWALSIVGIGPIIAAGLLAHIDVGKCACEVYSKMEEPPEHICPGLQTAGHIWSFAGLDPNAKWGKGQKRPWNARLKVICWHAGESFVKFSAHKNDVYGKFYLQRKGYEVRRNDAMENKDLAAQILSEKRIGKETEAYKHLMGGKLPPGHLHARAKRWAVKLFLAHYHEVAYQLRFGIAPPMPYPIAFLGHSDKIPVPNFTK